MIKIGIVGAGAMGSVFAYFFKKASFDVSIYEKNKSVVQSYSNGITIVSPDGNKEKIKFNIASNIEILKESEFIFLFVKAYATEDLLRELLKLNLKKVIIVTLQNGIGNFEKILKFFKEDNIIAGTTSIGAAKVQTDVVKIAGVGDITIGSSSKETLNFFRKILNQSGLSFNVSNDIKYVIWEKAIVNAAINPLGGILNIENGKIAENSHSSEIQKKVIQEAINVAKSIGMDFSYEEMVARVFNICKITAENRCSMLQDISNNRKTEIDEITGEIINFAKEKNIDCTTNKILYNLIKTLEIIG